MEKSHFYCVILAGGMGRRLWPCSREDQPKQFLDFFGVGRTQLQQTYDRFAQIIPKDNIYVNTTQEYVSYVRQQLPTLSQEQIMAESIHRNTAPSVAWAAHRIAHRDPKATLIVTPSDQAVFNEQAFKDDVLKGLQFVASHNMLLTMGVKPTRPEPGYGYIQEGDSTEVDAIYKVQAFTEKPDREFAKMFMDSGEWYWNTGLFLSNVHYLGMCLYKFLPVVLRNLDAINPNYTVEEEERFVQENFPSYPNISIDYGILEKCENVAVQKCNFGWADLGTWHGIYEAMSTEKGDNVVIDSEVLLNNAHNNIIKLPKGRLGVVNGLDGFIVAEKDNVLFICKKEDSSALVRKFVNEVQMQKGEEFV